MSIEWTNLVWKHSPYRGVQKLIHLNLADRADKDGLCFPKQSTIAEDTGATERYVRQTIKRMVADGVLIIIQKGRQYAYRLLRRPELSSGPDRNSVPVDTGTQFRSYIEPSREPSEEPSKTLVARGATEGGGVPVVGAFPDDPLGRTEPDMKPKIPDMKPKKRKKSGPPNRGTHAYIRRLFQNEAVKAGQRHVTFTILDATIKRMKEDYGWTYSEMEVVVKRFFVRYAQDARRADDVVKMFIAYLPRLEKETKDSVDRVRRGTGSNEDQNRRYQDAMDRQTQRALEEIRKMKGATA